MIRQRATVLCAALLLALGLCALSAPAGAEGKVNINAATVQELQELKGIGPVLADRIVEYREKHPFRSKQEIRKVQGVGAKTYEAIEDLIAIE
jgi:competence protein ComEA